MADVVSVITNPAGSLQTGAGNLLGGGLAVAQRAVGNIPGAGLAVAGLGQIAQDLLGGGERNVAGIYSAFLSQVLQDFANAPSIAPLWLCYLDSGDIATTFNTAAVWDVNSGGNHVIKPQGEVNLQKGSQTVSPQLGGGLAVMFCQGVETPSDSISVTRDTGPGPLGGYLPGLLGNGRNLNEVKLSFIENNASFVDFVLRPWVIHNSYAGYPGGIKTNITIEQYVKTLPKEPLKLRKKYVLHKAFPVAIDSEVLKYSDANDARQISFAYESYNIQGTGGWDKAPPLSEITLGDRLAELAINVATGLVNQQIEKFVSNLFTIKPVVVNSTSPSQDTIRSTTSKRVTPNIRDIPRNNEVRNQIKTPNKEDLPVPFEIVNNRLQKVITPEGDALGIIQQQLIRNSPEQKSTPESDIVAATALRQTFAGVQLQTPDTPTYTPYGQAEPTAITPKEDIPSIGGLSSQLKPVRRQDIAEIGSLRTQPAANTRNDSPGDGIIPVQIKNVNRNDSI